MERYDIWRYADRYRPALTRDQWLSLGEGWTPLIEVPSIAERLGLERLLLKREDLNPTGSHKDRGLAFQVSALRASRPELTWLTISSSGNAAIAAAAYSRLAGLALVAFVAPSTAADKISRLQRCGARVLVSSRALSLAVALADHRSIPNLRPSTDPLAIEGFQSIGFELLETTTACEALFSFVSSGSSFVAIGRAFQRGHALVDRPWQPQLHAVQGQGASPIAGEYDRRPIPPARSSRVGALGARKTRRIGEAKRLILASGGSGWVITDPEADAAAELLASIGIETSLEGAASLAAAGRAASEQGIRSAIVVLTGARVARKQDFDVTADRSSLASVEDLDSVLKLLSSARPGPGADMDPPT